MLILTQHRRNAHTGTVPDLAFPEFLGRGVLGSALPAICNRIGLSRYALGALPLRRLAKNEVNSSTARGEGHGHE
jgi:hypothetical protein